MNTILATPEVRLFVRAVRERLEDLTEEEREELVGGLDADINDLVEERGLDALPDPGDYARELRAAAGFDPEGVARPRRGRLASLSAVLDGAAARWDGFASGLPGKPWEVVVALRPVWWVLRAWVALQLVDLLWGGGSTSYGLSPVPSMLHWVGYDVALLVAAVLGSVLIGLGKVWPGRKGLGPRMVLLVLNLLAIGALPVTLGSVYTPAKAEAWGGDTTSGDMVQRTDGVSFNGEAIANIYPYDASGKPLTGVQLVDQRGRRLSITTDPYGEEGGWGDFTLVPWLNGRVPLLSVFPLAQRTIDPDSGDPVGDARVQTPPYASLPPVALAGVTPSVLVAGVARSDSRKQSGR